MRAEDKINHTNDDSKFELWQDGGKKYPCFSLCQNPLKVKSGTGWPHISVLKTQYSK